MQIGQVAWHQVPCVSSADPYRGEAALDAREEYLEEVFADAVAGATLEDGSTLADFLSEGLAADCADALATVLKLALAIPAAGERQAQNQAVTVAARELFDALQAVYVANEVGL